MYYRVCRCGRGYGSEVDGLCKYCREDKYSRAQCKAAGSKHRGDGLTLEQEQKIIGRK